MRAGAGADARSRPGDIEARGRRCAHLDRRAVRESGRRFEGSARDASGGARQLTTVLTTLHLEIGNARRLGHWRIIAAGAVSAQSAVDRAVVGVERVRAGDREGDRVANTDARVVGSVDGIRTARQGVGVAVDDAREQAASDIQGEDEIGLRICYDGHRADAAEAAGTRREHAAHLAYGAVRRADGEEREILRDVRHLLTDVQVLAVRISRERRRFLTDRDVSEGREHAANANRIGRNGVAAEVCNIRVLAARLEGD